MKKLLPIALLFLAVNLQAQNPPVADFTVNNTTICEGQCVDFTDMSTGAPTAWLWSFPGGTPSNSLLQNPMSICYSTAGTFDVTLIVVNGFGADTLTNIGYITVVPSLNPVITPFGPFCEDDFPVAIMGTPAGGSWSGPGVNGPMFDPLLAGIGMHTIYYLLPNNGCTDTATFVAVVNFCNAPDICFVTYDTTTGKNLVVWEENYPTADTFNIFRETNQLNVFAKIGSRPVDSLSVFLDMGSSPWVKSHRYRLSIVDTGGIESNQTQIPHKTAHLTASPGTGSNVNLVWENYEGFAYSTILVYRGSSITTIDSIDALPSNLTTYTDINPPVGDSIYMIKIVHPTGCNPTRAPYAEIVSNFSDINNPVIGTPNLISVKQEITIYPNPTSGVFTVQGATSEIQVFDLFGRLLLRSKEEQIDMSSYPAGIYMVKVGEAVRKLILQ